MGEAAGHFSVERVESRRVDFENGKFVERYNELDVLLKPTESKERFYQLKSLNKTMVLRVFLDSGLVSSDFQIDNLDGFANRRFIGTGLKGCHFIGNIVGQKNSSVVLDVCHGLVSNIYLLKYGQF